MLYEAYQNRMNKVAGVLSRIVRLLPLIIALFIVAAAAVSGYAAVKGMIVDWSCTERITYGEEFVFEGKTFFSEVRAQYCADGSDEWHDGTPTVPGYYRVRAVANGFFGPRYGEAVRVEVAPRDITVSAKNESVAYGSDITPIGQTVNGDTVVCGKYSFRRRSALSGEAPTATYAVTPDRDSIRILDANGNDVTAGYRIGTETAVLTVEKLKLTVTVTDVSKIYDGEALSSDRYEIAGSLCEGDRLEGSFTASIVNVGSVENRPTFRIFNGEGADVSEFYQFEYVGGTLTVEKRPVTVETESASFVYSGEAVKGDAFSAENDPGLIGGLVEWGPIEGHTVVRVGETPSFTDAGVYPNVGEFRIVDGNGTDMTENYDLHIVAGEITVLPRDFTVWTESGQWTYDGQPHSTNIGFRCQGILDGHRMEVLHTFEAVDVGEYPNSIYFVILDAEGVDVTENYAVQTVFGTYTVTPRKLTVITEDVLLVYDGDSHTPRGYRVVGLADTHRLQILSYTEQTNAGEYTNMMDFIVCDADGRDVTFNYEISVSYGTLTIEQRTLTIITPSGGWMYDGAQHSSTNYQLSGLLEMHEAVAESYTTIFHAGQKENVIDLQIIDQMGESVTDNYKIVPEYGTLTVEKRPITVRTGDQTFLYNGKENTYLVNYTVLSDLSSGFPLAVGDNLIINAAEGIKNVGTAKNIPIEYDIYRRDSSSGIDETGNMMSVTDNYIVTWEYGDLTVEPRALQIKPAAATKIYDAQPLTPSAWGYMSGNAYQIADGHTLDIVYEGSRTEVGSAVSSIVSVAVMDENNEDVTSNYLITTSRGTIEVKKRPIVIQPLYIAKVYDGTPLSVFPEKWAYASQETEMTVVPGHVLTVICDGSRTDVGTSASNIRFWAITDENGRGVQSNYEITTREGEVQILPVTVHVKPKDESKTYDGRPLVPKEWEYVDGSRKLLDGHILNVGFVGSQTEIGMSESELVIYSIRDGVTGTDVTAQYALSVEKGLLTVYPDKSSGIGDNESSDLRDQGGGSEGIVVGQVKTDTSGILYLRRRSYGNYANGGWSAAPAYTKPFGNLNFNYLTSSALAAYGVQPQSAEFKDMLVSLLPYYPGLGDYAVSDNDIANAALFGSYSLEYYSLPTETDYSALAGMLGENASLEADYRAWVYQNYLSVDAETRAYMQSLIGEQGFSASDADVIGRVALYIRGAAQYNLDYDRAMDNDRNIVIAFLETYKEGVCRHYASAATLLFRTLGIPARYVEGYMTETKAGEYVDITGRTAHAWVEVYIDGIGWIQVEVTGGFAGGGSGGGDGPETLVIEPAYAGKLYDGNPLYADRNALRGNRLFAKLISLGYTYSATVTGSQTQVGQSESVIKEFRLFDPNGEDVTDSYNIVLQSGLLKVFPAKNPVIKVYLCELQKYYHGKPLSFGSDDDYVVMQNNANVTFYLDFRISLTDVSSLSLSDLNERIDEFTVFRVMENGWDVSDRYSLEFVEFDGSDVSYTPIRVDPRTVEFTAVSIEKMYDGELLTGDDSVFISLGSLADGHYFVAKTEGEITDEGEAEHKITSIVIYDEKGNDVTKNYAIVKKTGVLRVVPVPK